MSPRLISSRPEKVQEPLTLCGKFQLPRPKEIAPREFPDPSKNFSGIRRFRRKVFFGTDFLNTGHNIYGMQFRVQVHGPEDC